MPGYFAEGGCPCRSTRYSMKVAPMFVHCCHCRWCQKETGSAFVLNALIEAHQVQLLQGHINVVDTPSESGRGQRITRCARCQVALWSNYAGAGESVHFVRVGTLDQPERAPPDIHIYTASKQPWVVIPANATQVPEYYRRREHWPRESIARWESTK